MGQFLRPLPRGAGANQGARWDRWGWKEMARLYQLYAWNLSLESTLRVTQEKICHLSNPISLLSGHSAGSTNDRSHSIPRA
jgi:hypothetical protein